MMGLKRYGYWTDNGRSDVGSNGWSNVGVRTG
jgi:hypothetical protein